jgi:hypothetical protein
MRTFPSSFDYLMRIQEARDELGRELFVPWYSRYRYGFVVPVNRRESLRRYLRNVDRILFAVLVLVVVAVPAAGAPWYWTLPIVPMEILVHLFASARASRGLERVELSPATVATMKREMNEIPRSQLWMLLAFSVASVAVALWLARFEGLGSLAVFGVALFGFATLFFAYRLLRPRPPG